ncbi:MAG: sigma-54 interaction domain-containing protein [Nitrospinota bacterium]
MLDQPESIQRENGVFDTSGILGRHPSIVEVKKLVKKVARTPSTVLLTGESGTGKELVAREIHRLSPRNAFPFLIVNCSALPDTLLESELFGHERGSFTGAESSKPGLFEVANGGTLFLDEVVDTSPASQAKLLGVLQSQEFRRVGGTVPRRVDVRIIAACNRHLEDEVKKGKFRQDLFFRLNTVTLEISPLRERIEDIPLLVDHFLRKYENLREEKVLQVETEVMDALRNYPWPGNVRELEHVIERALVLGEGTSLRLVDLPAGVREATSGDKKSVKGVNGLSRLAEIEREYVLRVLRETGGNKRKAALILGIDRSTLYRRLERYGETAHGSSD